MFHRLCGLKNGDLLSHGSRGCKTKIKVKVLTGVTLSEVSLGGLQMAVFSLSSQCLAFVYVCPVS